ncbi:MAG: AtpZ/AtpI family protein [Pseudomonadota bacterium]
MSVRVLLTSLSAMSDDPERRLKSLDDLGARVQEGREKAGLVKKAAPPTQSKAAGKALSASIEFVVSILVGAGLGFTIGSFFGAEIIGLLLGLGFGFAAGMRAILRLGDLSQPDTEKEQDGHGRDTD